MSSATVSQIVFTGNACNGKFTNLTAIASRVKGGLLDSQGGSISKQGQKN
jgi:hypothetical protein